MSTSEDFARRLFADFIASRIRAWGMEYDGSRPAMGVSAPGAASGRPAVASEQPGADARAAGAGSDGRPAELRILADPRRTPELGIG